MSVDTLWPMYVNRNIGISRCNSVINNVQLETPEHDPLMVETCSVTQSIKKKSCVVSLLSLCLSLLGNDSGSGKGSKCTHSSRTVEWVIFYTVLVSYERKVGD
jgi:hypothetical protein